MANTENSFGTQNKIQLQQFQEQHDQQMQLQQFQMQNMLANPGFTFAPDVTAYDWMRLLGSTQNPNPFFPLLQHQPLLQQQQQQQQEQYLSPSLSSLTAEKLGKLEKQVEKLEKANRELQSENERLKKILDNVNHQQQNKTTQISLERKISSSEVPEFEFSIEGLSEEWFKDYKHEPFYVKFKKIFVESGKKFDWSSEPRWSFVFVLRDSMGNVLTDSNITSLISQEQNIQLRLNDTKEFLIATIKNLKFRSISKNHGGHFTLECNLVEPRHKISFKSMRVKIKVFSKRRKLVNLIDSCELNECSLDTPLEKVKGIGPSYADKFAELGIQYLRDLGKIPIPIAGDAESETIFRKYIDHVRKPGGKSEKEFQEIFQKIHDRIQNQTDTTSSDEEEK